MCRLFTDKNRAGSLVTTLGETLNKTGGETLNKIGGGHVLYTSCPVDDVSVAVTRRQRRPRRRVRPIRFRGETTVGNLTAAYATTRSSPSSMKNKSECRTSSRELEYGDDRRRRPSGRRAVLAAAAYEDDDVCPEATGERCKVGVLDRDGQ